MPPASEPVAPAGLLGTVGALRALATILQYARFGIVGLGATLVHVLAYAGLIELLALQPLLANALGFALSVNVSFVGHRHWTFGGAGAGGARRALFRFWAVALFGFALNSLFVQLVTGMARLPYYWSIPLIAGVTPLATFALSKFWAFRR
jgi:putative flippase GtrA